MKKNQKNSIIVMGILMGGLITSFWQSIVALFRVISGKDPKKLPKNTFIDVFDFLARMGPKSFWKKPTGIRAGRSLSTFIHYIFFKDDSFRKK